MTTIATGNSSIQYIVRHMTSNSGGCNENSKYNNEQKALYHGLKSAYRMSREHDGEYGTDDPPYRTAAHIAMNVASAYFQTTDGEYTRDESREYIEENYTRKLGYTERFFGGETPLHDRVGDGQLRDALGHAWYQIDEKTNHFDAARTALAAAEAYLGGTAIMA